VFIFAALAEYLIAMLKVPSYLFAKPSEIIAAVLKDWNQFLFATLSTLKCAVMGLCASFCIGLLISLSFFYLPKLSQTLLRFAVVFQTVPIIAIAPLLVIWFGYGDHSIIASAFIASVFPIIVSVSSGMQNPSKDEIALFQIYHVKPWQELFYLRLPSALPQIFSGLKIAAGLAVIGAIVGEFISAGGLGGLIDAARNQQKVDRVLAAVVLNVGIGVFLVFTIDSLAHIFLEKRNR
jgi:NitT/TauT family transport system permease protein